MWREYFAARAGDIIVGVLLLSFFAWMLLGERSLLGSFTLNL